MGKFINPIGLKGDLRINIYNKDNYSLKIGTKIILENSVVLEIEKIRISDPKSYIKLLNYNTRNQLESIKGKEFYLPRDQFAPLKQNEIYIVDLIGSKVLNKEKKCIGIVIDVLNMPTQNLVVVEDGRNEILIPYVSSYVLFFDKNNKYLIVDNIEGLI